jgi:CheY-like chemotaxis protein
MLDIAQKEQKLGAGSNQQTLAAEHDLAVAENALVTAETDYAKARVRCFVLPERCWKLMAFPSNKPRRWRQHCCASKQGPAAGASKWTVALAVADTLARSMTTGNRTNNAIEKPYKLLIADDQPQILEALRLLLKPEGYQLEMVRTPALLLEALAA